MNRLQQYLSHAGQQFGVQVIAPFTLELDRDTKIAVDALLPELGNSRGMLVSESSNAFAGLETRLVAEGYGYTSYDQPFEDEDFDPVAYAEMFREWGWNAANSHRPVIDASSVPPLVQTCAEFPSHQVRGPEVHPSGGPQCEKPHAHFADVHHIPIREE